MNHKKLSELLMGILIVDNERVVKEYKDVQLKLKTIFENLIYP